MGEKQIWHSGDVDLTTSGERQLALALNSPMVIEAVWMIVIDNAGSGSDATFSLGNDAESDDLVASATPPLGANKSVQKLPLATDPYKLQVDSGDVVNINVTSASTYDAATVRFMVKGFETPV